MTWRGRQAGSVETLIARLDLHPHPEGGYFRETFRDVPGIDGRALSTAIYFLLPGGVVSRWHRVDAAEVWHWYGGAALDLSMAAEGKPRSVIRLGNDVEGGERPQAVVPRGVWQSAESRGEWTLVGCTVAPGFEFSGFELAPPGRLAEP